MVACGVGGSRTSRTGPQRRAQTNKTLPQSPSNSVSNSVNLRMNEVMNIAISERELDGIRKNISTDLNDVIYERLVKGDDSPNQELQHTTKSIDSIIPIVRSEDAISGQIANESLERRLQIRASSQQIRADLSSGDYSPGKEVYLTAISREMDARITGGEESGGGDELNKEFVGDLVEGSNSTSKLIRITNISTNLTQAQVQQEIPAGMGQLKSQQAQNHQQESAARGNGRDSNQNGTHPHHHEESHNQEQSLQGMNATNSGAQYTEQNQRTGQGQNDQLDSTRKKAVEVIHVESSAQFSFGVQAANTNPSKMVQQRPGKEVNSDYVIDINQVQAQQGSKTRSHDKVSNEKGTQPGKFTNLNLEYNAAMQSRSEDQVHLYDKGQQESSIIEQEQVRRDIQSQQKDEQYQGKETETLRQTRPYKQGEYSDPNSYHNAFPKISNNFEKHTPQTHKNQHTNNTNQSTDETTPNNPPQNKKDQNSEPAPYTVVQTMAVRLRHNQAQLENPIELVPPKITSKQGLPAIIYDMDDFMTKLAVDCKYTLIGKFSSTMPKMELIRKSFILQTQLTGGVNIAHYNARHVFIDLENELDYNTVWTQQRMTIEGKLMRIQTWTPTFTPEEETPIARLRQILTPPIKRTRASMAKVKVQVDLTKARPRHVWIGLDEEDLTIGRWQTIEYESIPPYCEYCKHQGHMGYECKFKIRDEEFKKGRSRGVKERQKQRGAIEKGQ
ncbi:hypothetical protein H5410_064421 [Solanum commersonii]|uniref:DUF4283 domain-containing protein n=1 Tax=Solanum commersonii TaxID=4109 RepID=A0A9J5VZH3_SOLCO|nr:hypothetical protein H5410_064421 [Solanum commersonii]